MAEAVVSMVVESLGNLLIEEAKLIHGVGNQVRDIRDELWWMQCFLKDADARQHEDRRVRTWVREIKEIAYDAGDVLESFILRVESRRGGSILNVLKRYACVVNECIVRHKVGSKIQEIETRISKLTTRLQTYGIRSLTEDREGSSFANQRQNQLRRSYSHFDEEDFVGLGEDVKNLVAHLVSDDEDGDKFYQVVAICGMGGLGKTTLAKKIYHHEKVKTHFDANAWVCISQQWQLTTVLRQILVKLINPDEKQRQIIESSDNDDLIRQLNGVQQEKKCLIVLDDIWYEEAWNCLKVAFPMRNMKGKLLLTSRNKKVAGHVNPEVLIHEPQPLNEDECRELLNKKAFTMRDHTDPEEFLKKKNLASEMIKECHGLPLAVIVLGGILAMKRSLTEWESVQQSIKSYLRSGEGMGQHDSGVSKILGLSYNDLPYQLKSCFLYLGKFQEDSEIETESLYHLWMAESMILSEDRKEGETMMDVAECYLDELAQRCMVQVQLIKEEDGCGKYKSCRLHDLLRDLCLSKAKEEDFFNTVDFQDENNSELVESSSSFTNKARRVAIYFEDKNTYIARNFSLDKETSQHLRSLLFFNTSETYKGRGMPRMVQSHLNDFKMLRVLAIEGLHPGDSVWYTIKRAKLMLDHLALLKAIGSLIHLKYLSLRDTKFFIFPSSINKLKHLQTLDLRGRFSCNHVYNANVLRKMRRLRHLYLPYFLDGKFKATKLRLDSLNNLETLENFDPSWCDGKDLPKLVNLRTLGAKVRRNLEGLKGIIDYLIGSTAAKHMRYSSIDVLYINFDSEKGRTTLVELLRCGNLCSLWMCDCTTNKFPRYEEVRNFSPSLTTLTLIDIALEEDPMPTLENLPKLRNLSLDNAFKGRIMVCSDKGFLQLISLELWNMQQLEDWRVEEGAMPKLSQLVIGDCKSLKMVPDGLRFITTLRELKISAMSKEFTRRVQVVDGEEGEDFDKIRHVASTSIDKY